MGKKKQHPSPRQRQPVNVGLLELSLENLRKQITVEVANNTIELVATWHTRHLQKALEDLAAHLEWHRLPWYKKLWLWVTRRVRKPEAVQEDIPDVEPATD